MKIDVLFENCDAVLITSPHNLQYFSGFAGGEGFCLLSHSSKTIFVDSRYTVEAVSECKGFEVVEFSGGNLFELITAQLNKISAKVIAYEDLCLTVATFNQMKDKLDGISFVPLGDKADIIRSIKTDEEIALLRKAERIGDMAFKQVLPMIKLGMTENDLAAELEYQMRKSGASGTSFDTIAVSGKKTAMPHGRPDEKKLEYGDFVTMDFGCIYKGYCSDMTRTVVMGEASSKQIEVYNTVLAAQLEGLKTIKAGVVAKDADYAARRIIEDAGYGSYFGHSLGHGVGLMIHEQPNLSPRSETVLVPNMIVTCEPGIYIQDFGGVRIEDMVAVKENGCENLTSSTKELIICG